MNRILKVQLILPVAEKFVERALLGVLTIIVLEVNTPSSSICTISGCHNCAALLKQS
jgi:hypothetical protein